MTLPRRIRLLVASFSGSLAILVLTFFSSATGSGKLAFQILLLMVSAASAIGLLIASHQNEQSKDESEAGSTDSKNVFSGNTATILPEPFLMETLMDNIPDHIYFKDRQSRFIRVNKAMARRFNLCDPAEAI